MKAFEMPRAGAMAGALLVTALMVSGFAVAIDNRTQSAAEAQRTNGLTVQATASERIVVTASRLVKTPAAAHIASTASRQTFLR